jgi:cob(I)alamin adenosyltransferase
MTNRLTKIVTRTGDNGSTGLADGSRLSKDAARIVALGDLDELNAHLGLLLCESLENDLRLLLLQVQNDLFDLGGSLAVPGAIFDASKLLRLDQLIIHYNGVLPPLKEFILPGGCRAAAQCHIARTVARRAERSYVHLMQQESISADGLRYLNRLSDLLFVLCRTLNLVENQAETYWQPS